MIGGSGFYKLMDCADPLTVETPFGAHSAPIQVGIVAGRQVAFLARHGERHEYAPHEVPYKANLWALASLGVKQVLGFCASGSLRSDIAPGDLVALDQLVDRTSGRADTFVSSPNVDHVSFADPYCRQLHSAIVGVVGRSGASGWLAGQFHSQGTVVVVQGPRFSTRAESRMYAASGFDVINMTQYPEAYLAREIGMCYAGLALVTDRDAGVDGDASVEAVTAKAAFEVMETNVEHARNLIGLLIRELPHPDGCACAQGGARSIPQPWSGH